ncbi:MAG: large conductance mechanosensitive channel protein MscL [Hyphomicrobiales bacterium]
MLKEFREFIAKGSVMDLAVGVIIGAAFGLIVKSLTDDIIMPIVGAIFGEFDFSNYFLPLSRGVVAHSLATAREQGAILAYGHFIAVAINFLILAFGVFLIVKTVNRIRREAEAAGDGAEIGSSEPPADIRVLEEIRDILKEK